MARLKPILEANIQEHSVMRYQEQVNGIKNGTRTIHQNKHKFLQ